MLSSSHLLFVFDSLLNEKSATSLLCCYTTCLFAILNRICWLSFKGWEYFWTPLIPLIKLSCSLTVLLMFLSSKLLICIHTCIFFLLLILWSVLICVHFLRCLGKIGTNGMRTYPHCNLLLFYVGLLARLISTYSSSTVKSPAWPHVEVSVPSRCRRGDVSHIIMAPGSDEVQDHLLEAVLLKEEVSRSFERRKQSAMKVDERGSLPSLPVECSCPEILLILSRYSAIAASVYDTSFKRSWRRTATSIQYAHSSLVQDFCRWWRHHILLQAVLPCQKHSITR